jgi:PAS domain S-box-containing protein
MTKMTDTNLNFKNLFQSLGTAYIVFDVNDPVFTVLDENESHANIAMVNRKDIIGKPLLEAFPDTSEEYVTHGKSKLIESIRKVIATGNPDSMPELSYDLRDQNGKMATRFWEVTHFPITENGVVTGVVQQTKDITSDVITRRKLQVTQDQLEQALSYSEVGTWVWKIKEDIVFADKNLVRLFGIGDGSEQKEVPIADFIESIHVDDTERVTLAISKAIEDKNSSFESEYRTVDYKGTMKWLLARGHVEFNEAGEAVRFLGLAVDITKRKSSENNLHLLARANTQFPASMGYKRTLDSIVSMIVPETADWCSVDLLVDGDIEQVAMAHKDSLQVQAAIQKMKSKGMIEYNSMNGIARVIRTGELDFKPIVSRKSLTKSIDDEKDLNFLLSVGFESVIIAPLKIDGETIGAISFVSTDPRRRYSSDDVEVAQALANRVALAVYNANLFEDASTEIEERKKLQDELEQFNSFLEERVQSRTEELEKSNAGLQAEIKHRQKLERQRMQHYIDLNKTKDEFISLSSHQLRTPATGVKQYLGMVLEGMAGDISELQKTFLQKAYESNERQLTIVSDLLKVAQVDAGKVKLRRAETNIAEMVCDVIKEQQSSFDTRKQTVQFDYPSFKAEAYVDPDKIRMVMENMIDNASKYSDPNTAVKISMIDEKNVIKINVTDNGVGIAPDDIPKLFEKFNRIHNHLSTHVGGTGLGLYWAKKIVDLHGGMIEVASVLDTGSTFSVSLPKNGEKNEK